MSGRLRDCPIIELSSHIVHSKARLV